MHKSRGSVKRKALSSVRPKQQQLTAAQEQANAARQTKKTDGLNSRRGGNPGPKAPRQAHAHAQAHAQAQAHAPDMPLSNVTNVRRFTTDTEQGSNSVKSARDSAGYYERELAKLKDQVKAQNSKLQAKNKTIESVKSELAKNEARLNEAHGQLNEAEGKLIEKDNEKQSAVGTIVAVREAAVEKMFELLDNMALASKQTKEQQEISKVAFNEKKSEYNVLMKRVNHLQAENDTLKSELAREKELRKTAEESAVKLTAEMKAMKIAHQTSLDAAANVAFKYSKKA